VRRVVIVGASLAGVSAARALRREGFGGEVILLGEEDHRPYDRPPLSKDVLAGKWQADRVELVLEDALPLDLRTGQRAASLHLAERSVQLEGGERIGFDGLVIATGASPRRLPALGPLEGVHYLRTLDDSLALRDELDQGPQVVVIGAGFIGAEVAATSRQRGLGVTILEALPVPLSRALGPVMGMICGAVHADNGVTLRTSAHVEGLIGDKRVEGVRVDGEVIPADVVVVGVGVSPTTGWLEGSGVLLRDGVVCDATLAVLDESNRPIDGVVAAGDAARVARPELGEAIRLEHWDNAVAQGQAAGRRLLAGPGEAQIFDHQPYFWSDQYDTKFQFVGLAGPDDTVEVVEGSTDERRFVAAYSRDGVITGALLVNRPSRMPTFRKLIARRAAPPSPQ
jgi:3-phenylpropionate/trans-cinnamate dioxygenase ferredoxin reductase subunit